jgi:hypothetical protein
MSLFIGSTIFLLFILFSIYYEYFHDNMNNLKIFIECMNVTIVVSFIIGVILFYLKYCR